MDWLNWISTVISSIAKEGIRLTSVVIILAALLKVPWVQSAILRYMPRRFKRREHTSNTQVLYEIRELRALWDAASNVGRVNTQQNTLQRLDGVHVHTAASTTPRTGIFQSKRRLTMNPSNIKWTTLIPSVLGGVKLILQSFGVDIITDDLIDQATNVAASVIVIIGILASHKKTAPIDKLNVPIESGV